MEFFTQLCPDLQILLLNEYVDPETSLAFLRASKKFNQKLNRDLIIKRYLKKRSYNEHFETVKDFIQCNICFLVTKDKKMLNKHMNKHNRSHSDKKVHMHKKPETCELCNVPYSNYSHKCLLKIKSCPRQCLSSIYCWIEVLCKRPEIYIIEPHTCAFKCRECKQEFYDEPYDAKHGLGESISVHFDICPNKLDMVSKYGIRKRITKEVMSMTYTFWICYYCAKERYDEKIPEEEKCTCVCRDCGERYANKIVTKNETYFICDKCAKCDKCGASWKESGYDKIWHYEDLPYCEKCVY